MAKKSVGKRVEDDPRYRFELHLFAAARTMARLIRPEFRPRWAERLHAIA